MNKGRFIWLYVIYVSIKNIPIKGWLLIALIIFIIVAMLISRPKSKKDFPSQQFLGSVYF